MAKATTDRNALLIRLLGQMICLEMMEASDDFYFEFGDQLLTELMKEVLTKKEVAEAKKLAKQMYKESCE